MICFDTNIVIYLATKTLDESIIKDEPIVYPSIVKIESLGYSDIRSIEEQRIRELFLAITEMPLTSTIIEHAIVLRQGNRMSLGDAIVAATAIENDCELWTANIDDFKHIENLKVINPITTV